MRTYLPHRAALGLAALLLVPLFAVACVEGTGPVVTETRDSRPFTTVEAGAGLHVVIQVGPPTSVTVEAQENLLSVIATEVSGDTLHVESTDDFASTEPVTVTVTTPTLEALRAGGGAVVQVGDAADEPLELTVKGGAQVTASGSTPELTLEANGGSSADLTDLSAARTHVALDGSASATIAANETVDGHASGGSHLTVRGAATVDVRTSGGAEVVRQ